MSITKGFESRVRFTVLGRVYSELSVDELLAHTRALEMMLSKHEWAAESRMELPKCPECECLKEDGHSIDCQLAKILEGVE